MVNTTIDMIIGGTPRPGQPGGSGGKNYKAGLKQLMINLNAEIVLLEKRGVRGMITATRMIKEETLSGAVVTPKEFGNLRESWFSVSATGVSDGRSPNFKTNPNKKKLTVNVLASNHASTISELQAISKASPAYNPIVFFGYSAPYAGYVHEFVDDTNINWTEANSGAKWFHTAIGKKKDVILKVIGENARIKR
jgi:hypothetical protein